MLSKADDLDMGLKELIPTNLNPDTSYLFVLQKVGQYR